MKTMIKKSLALILTLLVLMSAATAGISAFAAGSTEVVGTLGIKTKLFRYDEYSDSWVETDRARKGETLKARVYVDTDYYTNSGCLMVFYDDEFFIDNYMRDEIIDVDANPYYKDLCSMTAQLAFYSKNGNAIQRMIEDELFTEEFAMNHTCIGIMYMFDIRAYNQRLTGQEWLVEFELTVREDTYLTEGSVFTMESTVCSPDNLYAFTDVPYGREGEMIEKTEPLYAVYVDMYFENEPVSLYSNVILDANGGYFAGDTFEMQHVITEEIGTEVNLYDAPIPQLDGFIFVGWAFDDGTPIDEYLPIVTDYEDLTLYALWEEELKVYEIIFDANEGLFENATSKITMVYPVGAEFRAPDAPIREGFNFNGWVDEYGYPVDFSVMPETNLVIYADWEPVYTYTVTFFLDEDGTEIYLEEAYAEGDSLVYPAPPTVPGYTFESWSEVEGAEITGDLYVYPTYTANEYNVTVYGLYGDVFDEWVAFYGDEVTINDLFGKDDMDAMLVDNGDYYTFDGWNYNGSAITDDTVITVTDNVEIEGAFTAMDAKLIFDANGATFANGEPVYEVTLKYDDIITEDMYPEIPEYVGHTFGAWSLDLVGQPMDELEKTVSVTWVKNEYPVNYIVDCMVYTTVFAEYGTTVDATVMPDASVIPAGYTFLGWSLIENSSIPDNLGKVGDSEVNVYAVLEPQQGITYTVKIFTEKLDGTYELVDTIVYADGETGKNAPFVADEYVEGFTFNYDLSVVDVPVEGDGSTVLLVYYNRNSYNLITYSDDGILFEEAYRYGEEIDFIYPPEKYGFTFNCWIFRETGEEVTFPLVMPADTLELEASWVINNYDVIFDANGGEFDNGDSIITNYYQYGSPVVAPAFLTKEGHTFCGWSEPVPETMPAESIRLVALWEKEVYTLHFVNTGDYFVESIPVCYGDAVPEIENPYREGHVFTGWMPTLPQYIPDFGMDGEVITFGANWRLEQYTFAFRNTGDYVIPDMVVTYGDAIYPPENLEKTGYSFDGWDRAIPVTIPDMGDDGSVIEFNAVWRPNQYTVYFDTRFEDTLMPVTYEYGDVVELPPIARTGYVFDGWHLDGQQIDYLHMPAQDVTLVAEWTAADGIPYTVTFYLEDLDGRLMQDSDRTMVCYGTTGEKVTYVYPEIEGFTFDVDNSLVEAIITPDGSTEIELYYTRNQYDFITYTDGEVFAEYSYPYGVSIADTDFPTKVGHSFEKWIDRATGEEVIFPFAMPAENVELEASWVINNYNVIFDANGGTFADGGYAVTDNYEFGAPVAEPVPPTREGYVFVGWSEPVPKTMPAESIMLVAQWKIKSYTLHFVNTGDYFVESITVCYGDAVPEIENPYREGHVFTGWMPTLPLQYIPDLGMDGEVITFEANWRLEQYTFAFRNTGDYVIPDMVVTYGDAIYPPENLEKTGYSFEGWDRAIPVTIPDMGDDGSVIEFNAVWKVNKYTVYFDTNFEDYLMPVTYEYGDVVELPPIARTGYVFDGWHLDGQQIDYLHMPAQDVTLVAEWTAADGIPYTVTFYLEDLDGRLMQDSDRTMVCYGTTGEKVTYVYPEIEGFTFDVNNSIIEARIAPDGSTVLSLYFNRNQYNFTTYADGEVFAEYSYPYGISIADTDFPTKVGHSFVKWIDRATGEEVLFPFAMPAENVELEAVWSVNYYTVSFNTDGGAEIPHMNFRYGEEFTLPTAEKTGYSFAFWRGSDGNTYSAGQTVVMPADNMEFKAVWLVQSRKVTFIIGKDTFSFDVVPGQKIPMPDMSADESVEILYWLDNNGKKTEIPDIMPESNLTFTAKLRYICGGNPYGVTASYESGCFNYEGDELRFEVEKINGTREPGGVYFSGENYKQIALYNIKFYHGDDVVQPQNGNMVQISIPVPVAYKNSTSFMVIHRFAGGGYERFSVNKNGDALVFTVGSFSEFEILVKSETTIKTEPSKTAYFYKQALDLTGLTLEVLDENGNKTVISDTSLMTVNGYNPKKIGTQTLTVEYEGTSAQFDVTVKYAWWQMLIRILLLGFLWY